MGNKFDKDDLYLLDDPELPAVEREALGRQLLDHPDVAADLERLQATRTELRATPLPDRSEAFVQRVARAARAERRQPLWTELWRSWLRPAEWILPAALTAALFLFTLMSVREPNSESEQFTLASLIEDNNAMVFVSDDEADELDLLLLEPPV